MNFVMNHAPDAGSIARHVDQQSSVLPLYHGGPQFYVDLKLALNKWKSFIYHIKYSVQGALYTKVICHQN